MPLSMHLVANVCLSACGDNGLNCDSFKAILALEFHPTTQILLTSSPGLEVAIFAHMLTA